MKRTTPLKRSAAPKRKSFIRSRSSEKRSLDRIYSVRREAFLERHPLCQYTIASYGFREAEVLEAAEHKSATLLSTTGFKFAGVWIPPSREIHHRNKRHGERLIDERWFVAISYAAHVTIEANKSRARELGFLLPIQADKDGRWGAGNVGLPTDELLAKFAKEGGFAS